MTSTTTPEPRRGRWTMVLTSAGLIVAAIAVVTVVVNVVDRAEARFVGQTTNEGSLFEAATVDLALTSTAPENAPADPVARFALDAGNLLPGDGAERCLQVTYRGTLDDAMLRLFGERDGEPGLDQYLDTVVEIGTGVDPTCADFSSTEVVATGRLGTLLAEDAGGQGIELASGLGDGDRVTMRFGVVLADDNRAQGLDLRFWLMLEATS